MRAWPLVALAACGFPAPPNVEQGPAQITAFGFKAASNVGLVRDIDATVSGTAITATMPYSTDVHALKATFTTSDGAEVTVAGATQTSSATANSFLNPLTYSVSAADYSSQDYLVTVTAPGFGNAQTFATTDQAMWLAVGDVDGDGKPDVAVTNNVLGAGTVSLFLDRTPVQGFVPMFAAAQVLPAGSSTAGVAIADLNADGKADIVVANFASNSVSVFLNSTPAGAQTATFQTRSDIPVTGGPMQLAIGDVNGDGSPDIVVTAQGDNAVAVLLNSTPQGATTPMFDAATEVMFGTGPTDVELADINGDGKLDIVALDFFANKLSIVINGTAAGTRPASWPLTVTLILSGGTVDLAVGDLGGDNKPDIAIVEQQAAQALVFVNTTPTGMVGAEFGQPTTLVAGSQPNGLAIGNVIGSSANDVVVAAASADRVSVFETTSATATTVGFGIPQPVTNGGSPPYDVKLADFNGDGLLDLVVSTGGGAQISVQLLQP